MDSSNANDDDDMFLRRPKEIPSDNAGKSDLHRISTSWSMQRQRRQNKTFGSRNGSRLMRTYSLRQEFDSEASGVLEEPLDSNLCSHRRSSSLVSSEDDGYRELVPPPRPPRGNLLMTRSATLPVNMPGAPPVASSQPRRRLQRQQRSHSLALGPISSLSGLHSSRSSPSIPLDLFGMIENQPENYLAEENFDRDRKKPRGRRASTLGSVPSLQSPSFQEKMASLGGGTSSPFSFVAESPMPDASLDLFNSPGSKSSSRKRPVCGSPSSGDDGSTIMTMSSNTSSRRTRRMSASQLPPNLENPLYSLPNNSFQEVRGLHQESDDDESEENANSSFQNDVSFTSHTGDAFMHVSEEKKDDDMQQDNEIIADMSSLDDLKFLIHALEQEQTKPLFGGKSLWTVVPKQTWHITRRSGFVKWLTAGLQFVVSPVGNGLNVLKIPACKGRELLGRLKSTMDDCQDQFVDTSPPSQVLIASAVGAPKTCSRRILHKSVPSPAPDCALEFDLSSGLEKLSVHEKPESSSHQPFPDISRSSFGSARLSFDPSVYEPGVLELPGHETPAPRNQMLISSAEHTIGSRCRNSSISVPMSVAPMQNLEFVET